MRNWLSGLLSRAGGLVFHLLSVLEGKNRLPRATRHLKLALLGGLLSLIGCLTHRHYEPAITCYYVHSHPLADEIVDSLLIYPNPTRGADSVTIKAFAKTTKPDDIIQDAAVFVSPTDTRSLSLPLVPADGKFDGPAELLETKLYVGDLSPKTVHVISTITSLYSKTSYEAELIISKPDSTDIEKGSDK